MAEAVVLGFRTKHEQLLHVVIAAEWVPRFGSRPF